jgi:hypothetical protein
MATFVDSKKQTWVIRLTIPTLKHVRDALGIDVLTIATDGEGTAIRKLTDVYTFLEVLYHTSQRSDGGPCSLEEFTELVGLEQLEEASVAWFEALVDFFPPSRRGLLKTIVAEGKRVGDAMTAKLDELIGSGVLADELKSAADKAIEKIESISGSTSIVSPASSASESVTA